MTNKRSLATLIAAGMVAASVAARAEYATIPDPNLAQTAIEPEVSLVQTPAGGVQLAAIPDPNLVSWPGSPDVELLPISPGGPTLAVAPNPNLGEPAIEEVPEMHASRNADTSGPTDIVQ